MVHIRKILEESLKKNIKNVLELKRRFPTLINARHFRCFCHPKSLVGSSLIFRDLSDQNLPQIVSSRGYKPGSDRVKWISLGIHLWNFIVLACFSTPKKAGTHRTMVQNHEYRRYKQIHVNIEINWNNRVRWRHKWCHSLWNSSKQCAMLGGQWILRSRISLGNGVKWSHPPWTLVSLLPTCRTSKGVSSVVASELSHWKKQGKTWQRAIISYFRSSKSSCKWRKTSCFFHCMS